MRLLRRVLVVAGLVAFTGGLLLVALVTALHTDAGRAVARDRLAAALAAATGGRVVIGALETPRPGTVVVRDLRLSLPGESVVRVRRIEAALALPLPVPPTLRLARLHASGLVAHLVHRSTDSGGASDTGETRLPATFRIGDLRLDDARIAVRIVDEGGTRQGILSPLSVRGALVAGPRGLWADLASLDALPRGVALGPITATGSIGSSASGMLAMQLRATTTMEGARTSTLDLALDGPSDALRMRARVVPGGGGSVALGGMVDARATPAAYRIALRAHHVSPASLDANWPALAVSGRAHGRGRRGRHHAHGRLTSPAGAVDWQLALTDGHPAKVEAHASGRVADLRPLAGKAGTFPFRVEAKGSGAALRPDQARVDVTIGRGSIDGISIISGAATARLRGDVLRIDPVRLDGAGSSVTATGDVDLARSTGAVRLAARQAERGTAGATIAFARAPRGWTGTVRDITIAPEGLAPWASAAPATFALDDGFRLVGLRLSAGRQRIDVAADLGAAGAASGALTLADLDVAPLCRLAALDCAGTVNGTIRLSGTTRAPVLDLTADGRNVAMGAVRRAGVDVSLHHAAGRAAGTVVIAALDGTVTMAGSVPAPLPGSAPADDTLDLAITARGLSLVRLPRVAPTIVRAADGWLRADLHVGGTWHAPQPDGLITLRAPALELAPSGARWEDVRLVLRADGAHALRIEELSGTGGTGRFTGTGRLDFAAGLVPAADVRLAFDRFLAVDRSVLEASVTGTLRVQGPLSAPTVRGKLYVPDGTVRPAFLPAANAPTEPDPTIEVVGLPADAPSPPPGSGLGGLSLGLTITLGNGMHIRRRDADIQLGGTLQITREPPESPRVAGTVKIEKGWYTFSGRRFQLRPGTVRFDGGPVETAALDIEAGHRTGEYDVTVSVQGTVGKPELLLSSDPPLDEPDVLAVLLIGRPSGELNDSERLTVQAEAASLAVGYAVPGLTGALEDALPLEQVQVSTEQVRVGHRFGNDVFVSLSQQFVGWAGQTLAVEYAITPRLSVELSTSSRGSGAVDFFWRRRY